MQDDRKFSGHGDLGFREADAFHQPESPGLEPAPLGHADEAIREISVNGGMLAAEALHGILELAAGTADQAINVGLIAAERQKDAAKNGGVALWVGVLAAGEDRNLLFQHFPNIVGRVIQQTVFGHFIDGDRPVGHARGLADRFANVLENGLLWRTTRHQYETTGPHFGELCRIETLQRREPALTAPFPPKGHQVHTQTPVPQVRGLLHFRPIAHGLCLEKFRPIRLARYD